MRLLTQCKLGLKSRGKKAKLLILCRLSYLDDDDIIQTSSMNEIPRHQTCLHSRISWPFLNGVYQASYSNLVVVSQAFRKQPWLCTIHSQRDGWEPARSAIHISLSSLILNEHSGPSNVMMICQTRISYSSTTLTHMYPRIRSYSFLA